MGGLEFQQRSQTLVLTGGGVCLTGNVLHLGDAGLQLLVLGGQGLIAEHIAVVLLRLLGQGVEAGPEGGQQSLEGGAGSGLAGNACRNGQSRGDQDRHDHDDAQFGAEKVSHLDISSVR